jgi:hypothetical protein
MLGAWYFSDFNQICIFSINCNESNQYKLYEILSRAAYVFHAEGRIDVKKLIVAFHTFENAYKKEIHQRHSTPPTPPKSLPRIPMPVGKEERWVSDSIIDYSLSIDPLIHNIRWQKVTCLSRSTTTIEPTSLIRSAQEHFSDLRFAIINILLK